MSKFIKKTLPNSTKARAFSLIELAVLLTVISVIIAGILSNKSSIAINKKDEITNQRIEIIYKALHDFVINNNRLPCPAAINLSRSNANYGAEGVSSGSCLTTSGYYENTSPDISYAMVPVQALDLPSEIAEDGYGNKFVYFVDKNFAETAGGDVDFVSTNGAIEIEEYITTDSPYDSIETTAIFAILSYGPNARGAFPALSTNQISEPSDTTANKEERENAISLFDSNLIFQTIRSSVEFDDILFYKTKDNFLLDAKTYYLKDSNMTTEANI